MSFTTSLTVLGGMKKTEGDTILSYSQDGITWIPSSNAESLFTSSCNIIANNGIQWIAGAGYNETNTIVAFSSDGKSWSPGFGIVPIKGGHVSSITWDNKQWLLIYNHTFYCSTDGINWTHIANSYIAIRIA